ncbi:MAG: rod shape-determining protein MreD [Oscillospiraceae bacterium]|nr:rod shape-determining protein MreD [Oscillospiraceae bacterium]
MNNTNETNPLPRLRRRYLQWTVYGLLVLLVCVIQLTPRLIPQIYGGQPLLVIPLTVMIAFYTGPAGGAGAGFAAGFIWGVYDTTRLMGYSALVLMIAGCAAGLLVQNLLRNNLMAAMLTMAVILIFWGTLDWTLFYVLVADPEATERLLRSIIPCTVYTLAVSPLFYGLITLIYKRMQKNAGQFDNMSDQ